MRATRCCARMAAAWAAPFSSPPSTAWVRRPASSSAGEERAIAAPHWLLPPSPSSRLPLPFSIKSPGLQGRSTLGWGTLGVGTSRGLGGETGCVSGPRAGGKLSLPRRKDVGWAGGLFEIWPPTEYTPRPLPSHLRLPVPLSPPSSPQPMPGPCLGHISNQTLAQSWPLHTPEIPADSTQSYTWLFLGLWSPSGLLCCPVPPAALLHRGQATSLGLYKPSQPARRLPGPHSRTSRDL